MLYLGRRHPFDPPPRCTGGLLETGRGERSQRFGPLLRGRIAVYFVHFGSLGQELGFQRVSILAVEREARGVVLQDSPMQLFVVPPEGVGVVGIGWLWAEVGQARFEVDGLEDACAGR